MSSNLISRSKIGQSLRVSWRRLRFGGSLAAPEPSTFSSIFGPLASARARSTALCFSPRSKMSPIPNPQSPLATLNAFGLFVASRRHAAVLVGRASPQDHPPDVLICVLRKHRDLGMISCEDAKDLVSKCLSDAFHPFEVQNYGLESVNAI